MKSYGHLVCVMALVGCAVDSEPRLIEHETGEDRAAIAGGYEDQSSTAVVGIYDIEHGMICSGSLIAENVVLTARHCVAPILNGDNGVICGTTSFGAIYSASSFLVTTRPSFTNDPDDYHRVSEVVGVPPPDTSVCGTDFAIIILADRIGPSEAAPLVPRLDDPVAAGETFTAIGYGATDDGSTGSGTRRRRDSLEVRCAGESGCPNVAVQITEWQGNEGICHGDSGGPAIDSFGRVMGVTSRGYGGCTNPIYGDPRSYAGWVRETTAYAASIGGYEAPSWVTGTSAPGTEVPVGDPCSDPSECTSGHCVDEGDVSYCSRACSDEAPCPDGYVCDAGGLEVCVWDRPKKKKKNGKDGADDDDNTEGPACSATSVGSPHGSFAALPIALAILFARRGARRR